MTSRAWCFTVHEQHGADDDDRRGVREDDDGDGGGGDVGLRARLDAAINPAIVSGRVRYCIFQLERGAATGRVHAQGYIEFSGPTRLAGCNRLFVGHWEVRRGSRDQARDYCRKPDGRVEGPFEQGEWGAGGQGARVDLLAVKAAIDSGASESSIADDFFVPYIKYARGLNRYRILRQPDRDWKPVVTFCYGGAGVGKSYFVQQEAPHGYWKQRGTWWDGYDAHEEVILDDFYGWLPWTTLLHLLDRYPLMVETKGGQAKMVCRKIFITSNRLPTDWYDYSKFSWPALERRIDKYLLWDVPCEPPVEYTDYEEFTAAVGRLQ